MLDRKQIKCDVRAFLKGRWFNAFLAMFLVGLASTAASAILTRITPFLGLVATVAISPLIVNLFGYITNFARGNNPQLGDAFDCFNDKYVVFLGTYWWVALWTYLWTLLFIVPGIIKSIAYSFTFFIINENPAIGAQKAIKMSIAMTDGHKGELFVMGLSFILWFLLCSVTFGIASIYVGPYYTTTYAVYYEKFKERAIAEGKIDPSDFYVAQ